MQQAKEQTFISIAQSALAIPLAFVVWLTVSALEYFLLKIINGPDWNSLPGRVDSLSPILAELFSYGLGGFSAIYAVHWCLSRASLKFVFVVFSIPAFLVISGLPVLYKMYLLSEAWTFSWGWQVLRFLGGAATVLGAWLAYGKISNE